MSLYMQLFFADFNLEDFLVEAGLQLGELALPAGADRLLERLGVLKYMSNEQCTIDVSNMNKENGWYNGNISLSTMAMLKCLTLYQRIVSDFTKIESIMQVTKVKKMLKEKLGFRKLENIVITL